MSKIINTEDPSMVRTAFNEMRGVANSKGGFLKHLSNTPKFIGIDDAEMCIDSDGTKCCFIFTDRERANEFASDLSNMLNQVKVQVDSHLGKGIIYVPAENYEEAIENGVNSLRFSKNGAWINFYDEIKPCNYEEVLVFKLHQSFFNKEGELKKTSGILIRLWCKKLEAVLRKNLLIINQRGFVSFGVERTASSNTTSHEELLETIKSSDLLKNSPFEGYAYVDFCGKYIR